MRTPRRTRCIIAVQGPHARTRLATVAPDAAAVPRFGVAPFVWEGVPCVAAGTGYTGEDGVECAVPGRRRRRPVDGPARQRHPARPAWGRATPCAWRPALPLHGHELGPGITPLQAGLGWVVGWDKAAFRGRAALAAERERGVARRLVGLATEGRQPPRRGSAVSQDGRPAGTVTSGNFSPDARARDRPGPRRRPSSVPSRRWSSRSSSGAGRSRPPWSPLPSPDPASGHRGADGRARPHWASAPSSTRTRKTALEETPRGHLYPAHR